MSSKKNILASVGFEPATLAVDDTMRFAARATRHELEHKNAYGSSTLESLVPFLPQFATGTLRV